MAMAIPDEASSTVSLPLARTSLWNLALTTSCCRRTDNLAPPLPGSRTWKAAAAAPSCCLEKCAMPQPATATAVSDRSLFLGSRGPPGTSAMMMDTRERTDCREKKEKLPVFACL